MTTVNTSQCSTATRLTKIRKKKKMALLFVAGGRTFWNETWENKGLAFILCLQTFVPGSTAEPFQSYCLRICSLSTEKDGNLAADSVVPGNPFFKVHRPLIFLQENEAVRLTYLGIILQAAFYATFTGDTPSCPLHADTVWCIFSRTLKYLLKRALVLPRVTHGKHLLD